MSDHPAVSYLQRLFSPSTSEPVFLCSLPNDKNGTGVKSKHTREPDAIIAFVNRWDQPGRGLYYCMSTIKEGQQRNKANCRETPALVIDIDFRSIACVAQHAEITVPALRHPPTGIIRTGGGLHAVWQFKEAVATQDGMETLERVLRQLADVVGGDLAVCHPAALLRLPGTHNSKKDWREVVLASWSGLTYELDDLEEWLSEQSPVIRRKGLVNAATVPLNPYLAIANQIGFRPPLDVAQRLEQMRYQGAGEAGIHLTQLQVSASLVKSGMAVNDVAGLLLEATRGAVGTDGANWNWQREERNILKMAESALVKYPPQIQVVGSSGNGKDGAEQAEFKNNSASDSNIVDLGTAREALAAKAPLAKGVAQQAKAKKFVVVAAAVKFALEARGESLFFDSAHIAWWYRDQIWNSVDNFKDAINVEIQIAAAELGIVCDNRLSSEVRGLLERDPCLRRGNICWDQHGKVPTVSGLIHPATLQLEPATPEHYCTWRIPYAFEPAARAKNWLKMLEDCFGDLEESERKLTIMSLQELLGCGLIDSRSRGLRRALILIGGHNCGKSALLKVFQSLFGNAISCEIDSIDTAHGLMPFRHRLPWIKHEAFNQTSWHASGTFKTLVTGEDIAVNIKNGPIVNARWSGPIYFASNHPVQFREASEAIVSRIVPIHCTRQFDDDQPEGVAKWARNAGFAGPAEWIVATEMPGVLAWALLGLKRAWAQGFITLARVSRDDKTATFADANFVRRFVNECVIFNEQYRVSMPDFCLAVSSWFGANRGEGSGRIPSNDTIGRYLAALHDKRITRTRTEMTRWVSGLHLNKEGLKHFHHGKTARIYEGKAVGASTGDDPNQFRPVQP